LLIEMKVSGYPLLAFAAIEGDVLDFAITDLGAKSRGLTADAADKQLIIGQWK